MLARWLLRGIGIVNVVILARALAPDDFGVMAMAAFLIGLLARFSDLGAGLLLIREPNIDRAHCDTVWTIGVLQGIAVAVGLMLLAPFAASYFSEPRLVSVVHVLALAALIGGFENVGMVLLRRDLEFAKDFRVTLYKRLLTSAVTISLALALRSYWALVLAQVIGRAVEVWVSYTMHDYRPRLSLAKARDCLRFAASVMIMNVATYLTERITVLVGGRVASSAELGRLSVASEVSAMATEEVAAPISRALFPSLAKLAHDRQEFATMFLHVLSATTIVTIPIGFGLSAVARDFALFVLGANWVEAIPLIQIFALYGVMKTLTRNLTREVLIASGYERSYAVACWVELGITAPLVVLGAQKLGIVGIAVGALLASLLTFPIIMYFATRALGIRLRDIARSIWRPLCAGCVMYVLVRAVSSEILDSPVLGLLAGVATGVVAYMAALVGLWWLAGRPAGVEDAVFKIARRKIS